MPSPDENVALDFEYDAKKQKSKSWTQGSLVFMQRYTYAKFSMVEEEKLRRNFYVHDGRRNAIEREGN